MPPWPTATTNASVPDCHRTRRLQIDHRHPYADHGPTAWDNLNQFCDAHHDDKTHRGATLEQIDGHWHWTPPLNPDGTRLPTQIGPVNPTWAPTPDHTAPPGRASPPDRDLPPDRAPPPKAPRLDLG